MKNAYKARKNICESSSKMALKNRTCLQKRKRAANTAFWGRSRKGKGDEGSSHHVRFSESDGEKH